LTNTNWLQLRSGTDIRGTALADEGKEVELTDKVAADIGRSFASWLETKTSKPAAELTVAVGNDSRITGEKLKEALLTGLTDSGVDVYDCSLASTPAMFMSTILDQHQYDGAIMITASHLPYDRNGFKFFTAEGGLEKEDITDLLKIAKQGDFPPNQQEGTIVKTDLISDYSNFIVNKIRSEVDAKQPLAGFDIIVDAGNGAGGFFVEKILQPLGADTEGSQFLTPDGKFPNHVPNPENDEAMAAIKKAVMNSGADLGIIFDTDVDRAAVVDETGQAINRNKLIALASAIVLEKHPGATIVTDSVTSKGLTDFIEQKLGGNHHRFKRGYKNVINEAIRLNEEGEEAPLAIETSGHAAFKENHFLDDGAYLVAKILIKLANLQTEAKEGISDLIAELKETDIGKEYRMTLELEDFKPYGQNILAELKDYVAQLDEWEVAPKNYEGVRVNCGEQAWLLLRMSLHDPVLVLNVECETKAKLTSIKQQLKDFLANYDQVDLDPLTK
jgi:phosphomannomutase